MNIVNIPSPNFTQGRKNFRPEAIVIHVMAGSLSGTDSWFRDTRSSVSAHYGIGKSGEIHAYVSEADAAWHAGRVNAPSWPLIKGSGNNLYINPNYYTIGIEHEGSDDSEWTEEMYNTSATLIKDICTRWGIPVDRKHIVGHHEIFSLKSCPGHKADLDKLITLAGGTTMATAIIVPPSFTKVEEKGKVTTQTRVNLRPQPDTRRPAANAIAAHVQLAYDGYTNDGEKINGNGKWYYTNEGNWFWSGAVSALAVQPLQAINAPAAGGDALSLLQLKSASGAIEAYATVFLPYIMEVFTKYNIDTPARRLSFLAQVGHESGGLFYTEELASGKAYEGRKDLGNIHPGDGIRFKGRGLIQITGRANYTSISHDLGEDFVAKPQLLGAKSVKQCTPQQLKYAALGAGWFWNLKNLNEIADGIDISRPVDEGENLVHFKRMTKKINGGYHGLQERVNHFATGAPFF